MLLVYLLQLLLGFFQLDAGSVELLLILVRCGTVRPIGFHHLGMHGLKGTHLFALLVGRFRQNFLLCGKSGRALLIVLKFGRAGGHIRF